jgi:hypothetical protein
MKRVQAAQFEPVEAEAEYSFAVSEGDDEGAVSLRAGMAATKMVDAMIANKLGQVEVANPSPKTEEKPKAERKNRSTPPPAVEKPVDPPKTEAKPAEDDLGLEGNASSGDADGSAEDDLDLGIETPTSAPEITDVELSTAVTRRNGELIKAYQDKEGEDAGKKGTLLIRNLLVDKFGGAKIRELPQERRADFLKQLAALQYKAA